MVERQIDYPKIMSLKKFAHHLNTEM